MHKGGFFFLQNFAFLEASIVQLREEDCHPQLRGWRDESYEIRQSPTMPTLFLMERSASPMFGVRKYGVQINGHVQHSQAGLCLWLQKR